MAMIDLTTYIEQSGIRKARFGGYEPEDVRQAMLALCREYEQSLTRAENNARAAAQETEALRRRCQTLQGQNQTLQSQNASLAGQADQYARHHDSLDVQLSGLQQRNRSLTDQCAVLRMKNSDLTREKQELQDRAEEAEASLRIKGKELDDARRALADERDALLNDARDEADDIRKAAREDAEKTEQEAALKAEAIDQTAREQAIAQARKLVQSASDETKEIQSAHRLRLDDLKRQIAVMEKRRTDLINYLSKMGDELRDIETLARQEAPTPPPEEDEGPAPEPELDLSESTVGAAADTLRAARGSAAKAAAAQDSATPAHGPTTRMVGPTLADEADETPTADNGAAGPSPEFFDLTPEGGEDEEVPGAIFSYPILRQHGEPILLEDPPLRGPHTPVMPTSPTEEGEPEEVPGETALRATHYTTDLGDAIDLDTAERKPQPVNSTQSPAVRRRKAITAVRAILRRRDEQEIQLL